MTCADKTRADSVAVERAKKLLTNAGWSVTAPKRKSGRWECPKCGRAWGASGVVLAPGSDLECDGSPVFVAEDVTNG